MARPSTGERLRGRRVGQDDEQPLGQGPEDLVQVIGRLGVDDDGAHR
jgi:hypothetical protein